MPAVCIRLLREQGVMETCQLLLVLSGQRGGSDGLETSSELNFLNSTANKHAGFILRFDLIRCHKIIYIFHLTFTQ